MTDLNEMAKTLAGLSNEERDKLADIFVEKHEPQADRLATMLGWSLQDKQMRKEETMLKETTNTCGTHLQGKFIMPYEALEIALGEPHFQYSPQKDIEDKIDVEWAFELPSGKVVTVYNWKDGKAYLGHEGLPVKDITCWHVGGFEIDAMHEIVEIINKRLDDADYRLNEEGASYDPTK